MSGNSGQITNPAAAFAKPFLSSAPEKVEGRLHSVALRIFITIAAGILASGGAMAISYFAGMVVIPALVIIGVGALLVGSLVAWTILDGCFPRESITVAPPAGKPSPPNSQKQLPPPPSGAPPPGGSSGKPPRGSGAPPSGKGSHRPSGNPPRRPPPDIFEAFTHAWEQVGLGSFDMTSTQLKEEIAHWIRENYQNNDQLTALLNEDKVTKFGNKTKRTIEDYLAAAERENIVGLAHLYAFGNLHHVKINTPDRCLYEPPKTIAVYHIDIQNNSPILQRFTNIMPSTVQGILKRGEKLLAQGNLAEINELLNCNTITEFTALGHLEHHAELIDRIESLREQRERSSSNIFEGILYAWEATGLPPLGMAAAQLKGEVDTWIRENYQENDRLQELLREDMGVSQSPEDATVEEYLKAAESGNIVGMAHLYALGFLHHVRIIIIDNCRCLYEPQNSLAVCYLKIRDNPVVLDRFHDIRPSTVQEILEKAEALFKTDDDHYLPEIKELLFRQKVTEFTCLPNNELNIPIATEIRRLRDLYSKRTLAQYGLRIS